MKTVKRIIAALGSLIVLILILFYLWAVLPYSVMEEAQLAMESDASVLVVNDRDIYFMPRNSDSETALIIYPGTRVDSEAYSTLARALAEEGFTVVLADMPLDISITNIDRALSIMEDLPEIKSWTLAGHSLGGASAAFFVQDHPGTMDGLIMLGAYPGESSDLSQREIKVLSLYGEHDLIATKEEIMAKRNLFPSHSEYVEIKGGNHGGFGSYGDQKGDGTATISREEQQAFIAARISEFLLQF